MLKLHLDVLMYAYGTKVRRLMQEVTGEQKVLVCGVGSWVVVVQDWLN
jgi:hypothetical protein